MPWLSGRTGAQRVDAALLGGEKVTLDGATLASLGLFPLSLEWGKSKPATEYEEVPGRAGALDLTLEDAAGAAHMGTRTLTVKVATDCPWAGLTSVKRALGAYAGRSVEVWAEELGGTVEGRMTMGAWDDGRHWSTCSLTFECQPYVLGEAAEVELAEGLNELQVDGNRPALPVLTLTVSSTSGYAAVAASTGETLKVVCSYGSVLVLDCDGREATADGAAVAPTLGSDWPELAAGECSLTLTGCYGTLAYAPRWMM